MAITFDQTIGSRLKFYTSFLKLFSLGLIFESQLGDVEVLSARLQ